MFLQGKDDERCPKYQAEEMFVSLYCAGSTPTEPVLYPGEDHHFLGEGAPRVRADAAGRIIDWVVRYADARREPAEVPTAEKDIAESASAAIETL